jgi:hypothetical protein
LNPLHLPKTVYGPGCAALTLGLAYFCYRYVEVYTEHFREKLYEQKKNIPAPTLTASTAPMVL